MHHEFIWHKRRVWNGGDRCLWKHNDRQPQSHEGKVSRDSTDQNNLLNYLFGSLNSLHLFPSLLNEVYVLI